jgi:hypothetical protein
VKLNDDDRAELTAAADELDRLWDIQELLGSRDSRGGMEYERLSQAPLLRRLATEDDE